MTGERAERTKKSKYVAQSQRRKDRILNIQYSSPFQAMENVDEPVICLLFTKSKVGVERKQILYQPHTPPPLVQQTKELKLTLTYNRFL